MPKKKRQYLTAEKKTRIVKQFFQSRKKDPELTIAWQANKVGVQSTVLRRWLRDPRYGGDPNLAVRGSKTVLAGLPTEQKSGPTRAKPLIGVKFVCPHCGGAIIPGGNHA